MKIGLDGRALLSPTGRGVSHYATELFAELIRRHPHDRFELLVTGRKPFTLPEELRARNVHLTHRRTSNKLLNLRSFLTRRPRLDDFLPPVDVFFAPNLGFINVGPAVPLVVTVHDLSFRLFPEFYSRRERLWHQLIAPRRLLRRADRIIAVSGQTRDELVGEYGLPAGKISPIHSGVDARYRRPSAREIARIRRKYQLPSRYFLFVGAHDPRKRLATVLAGFERARRQGITAKLVLVGQASAELFRLVRTSGSPDVHLLGYLPEGDKAGLYGGALASILISAHEGFGFPPLESLAAGTPAIVSELPVFAETLGKAAITVPVDDPRALAKKLVELDRSRVPVAEIRRHGAAALRNLTWRRAADATYHELTRAITEHHAQ